MKFYCDVVHRILTTDELHEEDKMNLYTGEVVCNSKLPKGLITETWFTRGFLDKDYIYLDYSYTLSMLEHSDKEFINEMREQHFYEHKFGASLEFGLEKIEVASDVYKKWEKEVLNND